MTPIWYAFSGDDVVAQPSIEVDELHGDPLESVRVARAVRARSQAGAVAAALFVAAVGASDEIVQQATINVDDSDPPAYLLHVRDLDVLLQVPLWADGGGAAALLTEDHFEARAPRVARPVLPDPWDATDELPVAPPDEDVAALDVVVRARPALFQPWADEFLHTTTIVDDDGGPVLWVAKRTVVARPFSVDDQFPVIVVVLEPGQKIDAPLRTWRVTAPLRTWKTDAN